MDRLVQYFCQRLLSHLLVCLLLKSLRFILAQSGTSIEFRPLSFNKIASVIPRVIQSARVIIYGNQKHSYLNWIKAEQLMIGKQTSCQYIINKPIWDINNPSTLSRIDEILSAFITSFLEQSDGILIVFFSIRFQRAHDCNYGIPRLSQNSLALLVSPSLLKISYLQGSPCPVLLSALTIPREELVCLLLSPIQMDRLVQYFYQLLQSQETN